MAVNLGSFLSKTFILRISIVVLNENVYHLKQKAALMIVITQLLHCPLYAICLALLFVVNVIFLFFFCKIFCVWGGHRSLKVLEK